jgi:GTP-binding protein
MNNKEQKEKIVYSPEKVPALFRGQHEFMLSVAALNGLPAAGLPEIAFAGRSNVGKSSLINALTGRRTLARTSNTPGRTQHLNFFNIGPGGFALVDMPGYGYAKVSKTKVAAWTKLLKDYLRGRANLRLCCLLIDARHGIKENDIEMMSMLDEAAVPYRIILTKADKVKKPDFEKLEQNTITMLKKHPAAFPFPLLTSSEKMDGIIELQNCILDSLA